MEGISTRPGSLMPYRAASPFGHDLRSSMDADQLWVSIAACFVDSTRAPLWPPGTARLRLLGDELRTGAVVEARYEMLRVPLPPVHYSLLRYDAAARSLQYWTEPDHPLWGGAEVSVRETPSGSVLSWHGAYQARGLAGTTLLYWVEHVYVPRFFGALAKRLRELENPSPAAPGVSRHARAGRRRNESVQAPP